jgi:FAD/FMN-containing dehydrogenase
VEATAIETFDVHFNDRGRWIWAESFDIPEDCYFDIIFTVNAENKQELKGKEQAINDISKTHKGTYLPGLGEFFHTQWPTAFFAAQPRVRRQTPAITAVVERDYTHLLDELIFPSTRLPEVYNKIMELLKKYKLWELPKTPVFDGYCMKRQVISSQTWICINENDPYWVAQYRKCRDEFREWYGEKGGIFQTKFPPLVPEYTWTNQLGAFKLLNNIKRLLDPNNILSPGTFELRGAQSERI